MKQKIANFSIAVPYKRAGNSISQEMVNFDLFKEEEQYSLVPCLNKDELRIANLPTALEFVMEDDKPVSLRGIRDGNFHVIQDAVLQLKETQQWVD